MSTYDELPKGSQVKCWDCEGKTYKVGDTVPTIFNPLQSYIVLLEDGGYAKVSLSGRILEIVEDGVPRYPEDFPSELCIDKWGSSATTTDDLKGRAMFGYHYYYWHESHKDEKA